MKKRKKRKLFFMVLWLLLVAVLFGSSTYAWFSTNRVVYINSLNVNVRAEGGIEISADGDNWKTILAIQDLIDAHNEMYPTSINQIPDKLEPVSTGKSVTNGFLDMYYGLVEIDSSGNYVLTSTKSVEVEGSGEESEGKFVAFDIFLKTQTPTDLYLTTESGAVYNGNSSVGIENAVRVAFLVEGNVSEGTVLGTIQGLRNANVSSTYIWEPNYDIHTEEAVRHAFSVYGINTSVTGGARLSYDGIIAEFDKDSNITVNRATASNYSSLFKTVNVDFATENGFMNNKQVFGIDAGITKVRVYMWIEGQDVDCEDNASVGNFTFTLQLTSNRG